jgi:hypothetical protein
MLWVVPAALLLGWVYASPYLAVRDLRRAALDGNADALREAVDFPALRASLKEELGGQVSKQALAEMKRDGNGFAALGSALVSGFVNLMIDQLVTPQGIANLVQGKRAEGTPENLAGTIERFATKPQSRVSGSEANISEGYESLDRFCVRIFPSKSNASITFVWLRSGLTRWRLSGVRLPDLDELVKETAEANTVPAPKSGTPDRDRRAQIAEATPPTTAAPNEECLPYAPARVTLSGTLISKTFPGPPNFRSIEKGDEPETFWILALEQPICTTASGDFSNPACEGVSTLQLLFSNGDSLLLNRKVRATGSLFSATTAHHHTRVMLQIASMEPAETP